MQAEIHDEHRWLSRLAGKWNVTYSGMGPEGENIEHPGAESVRILGGVWAVCEGTGEHEGATHTNIMTLGYDPTRKRFVGTFIGSVMTHMWIYEGELDASGDRLELMTEGPSFTNEGEMSPYRDSIEFISDDERVLTSEVLEDGEWKHFMQATYRRAHE